MERRTPAEVTAADGLADWRVLLRSVHATFATGSFATGVELVARIGDAADAANHHPDVTLTYPRVAVAITTHDADGLTDLDIDLARTISHIARDLGVAVEPAAPGLLELAIDAVDIPVVRRFWHAVLDLPGDADADELVDGRGRYPTIWFQQMDEPRPQRNRIHLDLHLPPDLVERRLAAAIAAGGTLVSDDEAPSYRVVADPEGNEVCLCTWRPAAEDEG